MPPPRRLALVLIITLAAASSPAANTPLRQVESPDGSFVLRIDPGDPDWGRSCRAMLNHRASGRGIGRRVWQRSLVNDTAPVRAFVRNDGRFVVTLDEHTLGGRRNALVVYGPEGRLLRHFALGDLLTAEDWMHVTLDDNRVAWADDAPCAFTDDDTFTIHLPWDHALRIDLRTLQPADGPVAHAIEDVPPAIRAALYDHIPPESLVPPQPTTQPTVAPSIEEPAATVPPPAQPTPEIITDKSPPDPAGPTTNPTTQTSTQPAPAHAPSPVNSPPPENAVAAALTPDPKPAINLRSSPTAEPSRRDEQVGISVPAPNPQNPTDYLAWLRELATVRGADAARLYQLAVEEHAFFNGDATLLTAALRGDPAALQDAALIAWLDSNAAGLAAFREASRYAACSGELESEDGGLLQVRRPGLSGLRDLARIATIEGRRQQHAGDLEIAIDHYLDTLSAGAHIGQGLTFVESLVGAAMQGYAAQALLDLQTPESATAINYADLARAVESAYRPLRSPAQTVQIARAFYLDAAQRLWRVDTMAGKTRLDRDHANKLLEYMCTLDPSADPNVLRPALAEINYADVVSLGNVYYDALTDAFRQPYPRAAAQLAKLEAEIHAPDTNPFLRHFIPPLQRYHQYVTRAATLRRATILITHLHAYDAKNGHYPPTLTAAVDTPSLTIDPFSDAPFKYNTDGETFTLYSIAADGQDDGGTHDRRGTDGDLVYWPPPQR